MGVGPDFAQDELLSMSARQDRIFLFSKTPYPGVNHIPILRLDYLQVPIDFSSYDYIIATSKEVFSALDKLGNWKSLPVLAISETTAGMAKEMNARVLDIGDGYGKSLVEIVKEKYGGLRALYPHAKVVAFDIAEALKGCSVEIDSFIVYKTSCSQVELPELPSDAICVFTSPSSVECFEKQYAFLPSYQIVCIGETTRCALPEGVRSMVSERTSVHSAIECAKKLI